MCLKFGDIHMYHDAQNTQSSLLDLQNVFSVLDNGLGHLGIARHRPSKGFIHRSEKRSETSTMLLEAATIRTGLEPAIFAILRQPESNALPLGHPTRGICT